MLIFAGSWGKWSVHTSPLREGFSFSIPYSSFFSSPRHNPHWSYILGACFDGAGSKGWHKGKIPTRGKDCSSLLLKEKIKIPPDLGSPHRECSFWQECSPASPHLGMVLLSFAEEALFM